MNSKISEQRQKAPCNCTAVDGMYDQGI